MSNQKFTKWASGLILANMGGILGLAVLAGVKAEKINALEAQGAAYEAGRQSLDNKIDRLLNDVGEIKAKLGRVEGYLRIK